VKNVSEGLKNLREKGVSILADAGMLKVSPGEKLTDDDRNFIRENKAEIISILLSGDAVKDIRNWTPGNEFTCACGRATGWRLKTMAICPGCYYNFRAKRIKKQARGRARDAQFSSMQLTRTNVLSKLFS